jgi:hypothetical protein
MRLGFLAALSFFALFMTAAPVRAHHSFAAEYDSKQIVTLKGVLTKIEWTNPHAYIYVDVKDESGNVTTWALEGYPPNTLKRTGFARDLLKVGDEITVTAYKAKDASFTGAAREITFPDGSKKFLGPTGQ